jgi:hypothetical protein
MESMPDRKLTIRQLYPDLTEQQLKKVAETLYNYAAIAWRVCERLELEKLGNFDGEKDLS